MRLFNQFSLSTPESVELEFTLAGIGNRTLALLIDYSVLTLLILGFWIIWGIFSFGLLNYLEQAGVQYNAAPLWLLGIWFLLTFVFYWGYFVYFEVRWQGQTPGKRFAKIRVVQDDGRPLKLSQAVLRSLLRLIDDFPYFPFLGLVGMLFILSNKREKRVGDWAAGTMVIQEEQGDRKATLEISDHAQQLATKLPELAELDQLLPDDYAVIREYLQRRSRMSPKARSEKSMELARQLRALIALEVIPPDTTSDHFLEAVYLAYQQMAGSGE